MRVSNNIQTYEKKENLSFKRYYDKELKRAFEKELAKALKKNKNISPQDVLVMRNSIESYNAFYKGALTVNAQKLENDIYKKFKIPCDFGGDKFLAAMAGLTLNIFQKLKLPLPTGIYKRLDRQSYLASCDTINRYVVFNALYDWSDSQSRAIAYKLSQNKSTGHFLHTPLHEFMHSVHLFNLHKVAADKQQLFDKTHSKIFRDFVKMDFKTTMIVDSMSDFKNKPAANYVSNKVSEYGSTKPIEMFADIGAKMIAEVLDTKTILPKRNPFVFKDFTGDKFLMQMMNDFWRGNFSKYI